jgi:hypothetical protein
MVYLMWTGVGLTLLGILSLAYCIRMVMAFRRQNLGDQEMRAGLQRAVAYNMASLAISGLGLMLVVMGVILK